MILRVFVPGTLTNPLNGSHGHWSKHRRWAKTWRERTSTIVLSEWSRSQRAIRPEEPKLVTFIAFVGAEWDDDNLRAALKPTRDALKDMRIVDDDRPSAGHTFRYEQEISKRKGARRGVEILVESVAEAAEALGR